jgi:hypothetical protein
VAAVPVAAGIGEGTEMIFNRIRLAATVCGAATALAVLAGPVVPYPEEATSQPAQACSNLGPSQVKCVSPGNVQINDSPPQVNFFPYSS